SEILYRLGTRNLTDFRLVSLTDQALEIVGFRNPQKNRMVFGLASFFENFHRAMRVLSSRIQHFNELGFAHMKRARTRDQNAARTEHLEGAQVQLFVSAQSRLQVAPGPGEGRRI